MKESSVAPIWLLLKVHSLSKRPICSVLKESSSFYFVLKHPSKNVQNKEQETKSLNQAPLSGISSLREEAYVCLFAEISERRNRSPGSDFCLGCCIGASASPDCVVCLPTAETNLRKNRKFGWQTRAQTFRPNVIWFQPINRWRRSNRNWWACKGSHFFLWACKDKQYFMMGLWLPFHTWNSLMDMNRSPLKKQSITLLLYPAQDTYLLT